MPKCSPNSQYRQSTIPCPKCGEKLEIKVTPRKRGGPIRRRCTSPSCDWVYTRPRKLAYVKAIDGHSGHSLELGKPSRRHYHHELEIVKIMARSSDE